MLTSSGSVESGLQAGCPGPGLCPCSACSDVLMAQWPGRGAVCAPPRQKLQLHTLRFESGLLENRPRFRNWRGKCVSPEIYFCQDTQWICLSRGNLQETTFNRLIKSNAKFCFLFLFSQRKYDLVSAYQYTYSKTYQRTYSITAPCRQMYRGSQNKTRGSLHEFAVSCPESLYV